MLSAAEKFARGRAAWESGSEAYRARQYDQAAQLFAQADRAFTAAADVGGVPANIRFSARGLAGILRGQADCARGHAADCAEQYVEMTKFFARAHQIFTAAATVHDMPADLRAEARRLASGARGQAGCASGRAAYIDGHYAAAAEFFDVAHRFFVVAMAGVPAGRAEASMFAHMANGQAEYARGCEASSVGRHDLAVKHFNHANLAFTVSAGMDGASPDLRDEALRLARAAHGQAASSRVRETTSTLDPSYQAVQDLLGLAGSGRPRASKRPRGADVAAPSAAVAAGSPSRTPVPQQGGVR